MKAAALASLLWTAQAHAQAQAQAQITETYLDVGEPKPLVQASIAAYAAELTALLANHVIYDKVVRFGKGNAKRTRTAKLVYNHVWQMIHAEKALQRKDKQFRLPAWDFLRYANDPAQDPVFSPTYFGQPTDGCVNEGAFRSYRPKGEACYRRNRLNGTYVAGDLATEDALLAHEDLKTFQSALATASGNVRATLWGKISNDYVDPLKFSMAAFEWNLLVKWGKRHNKTIDVDFDGQVYLGSNKTLYIQGLDAYQAMSVLDREEYAPL